MAMKRLGILSEAISDIDSKVDHFIQSVRRITKGRSTSLPEKLSVLRRLRSEIYEELNQIQHEYMILMAIGWLIENKVCDPRTIWDMHPRQTSALDEPDLRGTFEGKIVVSAEVTTSENPEGIIDTRIRRALKGLHHLSKAGKKYYFVRTVRMAKRARTKARKNNWRVKVVELSLPEPPSM
ncbi:MAG TPA: hypothetical protein VG962_13770 [Steroidobacteraceae bacterium]|nr:hypothetical protein [Steroidobacteraceae bacterium]